MRAATGPPGRAHAVKPGGKRNNRNTGVARGIVAGTVPSSLDAGTAFPKKLRKNLDSAGPRPEGQPPAARWVRRLSPRSQPVRRRGWLDATAAVGGTAGSGHSAAGVLVPWHDSAGPHANAARNGLLVGTTCCNNAAGDETAGRVAHTPSASTRADTCVESVARNGRSGQNQVGPREWSLPKVKPRRRAVTRLRGVVLVTAPSSIAKGSAGSRGQGQVVGGVGERMTV